MAHRLAWTLEFGDIPEGAKVLHHCDNPPCCMVDHLFLGDLPDNNRDRHVKSRDAVGSGNGNSKLSESDIPAVRALYESGLTMREVGARFGVSYNCVRDILIGKTWAHV